VLVRGRFLLVRPFPTLQIPNLKAALSTHERDLAFQSNLSAKVFRQYQPTLSVRACMLSPRMQMA